MSQPKPKITTRELELFAAGRLMLRRNLDGDPVVQVEKHARLLSSEVREAEDGTLVVPVVVSDGSVDRYGDILEPGGWDVKNYTRNPVWLVDHEHTVASIVGVGRNPREVNGAYVLDYVADAPDTNDATRMVRSKLKSGSLRAVSVGFKPRAWTKILDDEGEWTGGFRFTDHELYENSWVAVPANPNATLSLNDLDEAGIELSGAALDERVSSLTAKWDRELRLSCIESRMEMRS